MASGGGGGDALHQPAWGCSERPPVCVQLMVLHKVHVGRVNTAKTSLEESWPCWDNWSWESFSPHPPALNVSTILSSVTLPKENRPLQFLRTKPPLSQPISSYLFWETESKSSPHSPSPQSTGMFKASHVNKLRELVSNLLPQPMSSFFFKYTFLDKKKICNGCICLNTLSYSSLQSAFKKKKKTVEYFCSLKIYLLIYSKYRVIQRGRGREKENFQPQGWVRTKPRSPSGSPTWIAGVQVLGHVLLFSQAH